jgi:hypothetical protein
MMTVEGDLSFMSVSPFWSGGGSRDRDLRAVASEGAPGAGCVPSDYLCVLEERTVVVGENLGGHRLHVLMGSCPGGVFLSLCGLSCDSVLSVTSLTVLSGLCPLPN